MRDVGAGFNVSPMLSDTSHEHTSYYVRVEAGVPWLRLPEKFRVINDAQHDNTWGVGVVVQNDRDADCVLHM